VYAFVVILVCTLGDGNSLLEFWNVNLWGVAVAFFLPPKRLKMMKCSGSISCLSICVLLGISGNESLLEACW